MDRDHLIGYCLGKPGAEESYPWGDGELVAKVGGKGFAFIGLGAPPGSVSLKCGRDRLDAAPWRARYPAAISVSSYTGRFGWNTVVLDGSVPAADIRELVDDSYGAAVAALPKSRRPAT